MDNLNFNFTAENVSKYWNLLNNSNNSNERKIANEFLMKFKKNCTQCLEISFELFKSSSLDDKLISSLLIYQYLKENPKLFLNNEQLFTQLKSYLLNSILIPYTSEKEIEDNQNINKTKIDLIIERICYSMSIIILLGCCSFWPNAIDDMISFGKETIKHTYLMTIIFGNCNIELKDLYLPSKYEFIIKNKFIEKKDEFKNFINTIFINTDKIDKKLYNKTVDLAINLTNFEVNILFIPNLIKIVLNDINLSNIDSLTKLLCESFNFSKSKKLEDEYTDIDIYEFDNKISKEELMSFNYIIDIILEYIQKNNNNLDVDIAFGLGRIFSSFTENYIYMFFKKDSLSQKIFNLFYFFISHKIRKISQLFFETIAVMKNFIKGNYNFSNYNTDEKIQFMNYLIKILYNITNNCLYKTILKKQDILLTEEYITIQNININNNKDNINNNIKEKEDDIDEINEITVDDYRTAAEDAFINIFEIFAVNYGKDGVNYFLNEITKDIIPLLEKGIDDLTQQNILYVEVVIYIIKNISNSFEDLSLDKTPLNKFVLIIMKSQIVLNNFILINFLLLIDAANSYFDYNKSFFYELIIFLLNQMTLKINNDQDNSEETNKLISLILNHICEAYEGEFIPEIWDNIYQIYLKDYDKFNFEILNNITEALCSLLIIEQSENVFLLSNDVIINYLKKIIEAPIIRIIKIGEIILNKNKEINGDKEKEKNVRLETIKNFNGLTSVLKQSSFIEDKNIINIIFDEFYKKTYQQLSIIINEYNKDSEIINCFMNTFIKCSSYLNIEALNSIYQNFNELMINSFLINNDNYQCINVLKNIYNLKLNNIKQKNLSNKEYAEIYNNFFKLIRQICSAIISSSNYKLELMLSLSSFFMVIFPHLNSINKEENVIISDTIIIFNEGIKTICENKIINNILYAYISFLQSPNYELINEKFAEIIKSVFSSFDHFNTNVLQSFATFCFICLKINKRDFITTLKEILCGPDFNLFNDNNKTVFINYLEHFSDKIDKLKNFFGSVLYIIQKNINASVDEIFEKFSKEIINDKKSVIFF